MSIHEDTAVAQNVMEVEDVKMYFPIKRGIFRQVVGYVKAVDGASVSLKKGETFGIVGESGSGKTTLGKVMVGLYAPTNGKVFYRNEKKTYEISTSKIPLDIRQKIQMIFQDPFSSLDPRMTVESTLREGLEVKGKRKDAIPLLARMLEEVGLSKEYLSRYPHELSGGQRQRIALVRAMVLNPDIVVCDEPTSALDVSVQAQVVNLLQKFQEELNLTYVFITHNISLAKYLSDRIAVMYLGKIVEECESEELFENPLHPYTRALLQSIPRFAVRSEQKGRKQTLKGEIPSPINIPSGCRFRTRCPYATKKCEKEEPSLKEVNGHLVACHYAE